MSGIKLNQLLSNFFNGISNKSDYEVHKYKKELIKEINKLSNGLGIESEVERYVEDTEPFLFNSRKKLILNKRNELIRQLHTKGYAIEDIAKNTKLSEHQIYNILKCT